MKSFLIRMLALSAALVMASANAAYSADNDGRGQGNPGHSGKAGENKSGTKSGSGRSNGGQSN